MYLLFSVVISWSKKLEFCPDILLPYFFLISLGNIKTFRYAKRLNSGQIRMPPNINIIPMNTVNNSKAPIANKIYCMILDLLIYKIIDYCLVLCFVPEKHQAKSQCQDSWEEVELLLFYFI